MNLYSEIYSAYYNIISTLLRKGTFTGSELSQIADEKGFGETMLYLIPKISDGSLSIFEKDGELYTSVLSNMAEPQNIPLSLLQKRWLKSVLGDRRIRLFLDGSQINLLKSGLDLVEPLFKAEDFEYVDRFTDGDDFESEEYQRIFRTVLCAIKQREVLDISFNSRTNKRVHYHFIPCKLEYSVKNDRFRLLAVEKNNLSENEKNNKDRLFTINLSRISEVFGTGTYIDKALEPDIDQLITASYYKEPVTLHIKTERNALERAMLQFASYKKNTTRINDNLYKCEIYYNEGNETELLIEVLSFGSAVEVIGNERFLKQLKQRLEKQNELMSLLAE